MNVLNYFRNGEMRRMRKLKKNIGKDLSLKDTDLKQEASIKHRRILNTISFIRESHSEMVNIFSKGSCLNFFCILHSIYPEAECYFNIDHVISKIDGKYYDITGEVNGKGYMKWTQYYNKRRTSRSFTLMYNNEYEING